MAACPRCGADNAEGSRFCRDCGTELGDAGGEVRKIVTVLFCDLVGFTGTTEPLDPEAVRRLQRRYFDAARASLEGHDGTVEKFIGDAVMAVFGIPRAHEDDAVRALRAAIDLRRAIQDLGLECRIGVNTGEVVAGAGDALVTGDAVNTASRFEHAAFAGQILLGAETLRLCRGSVEVDDLPPLDLKGKRGPVPAFRLIRVVDEPAIGALYDTPFVGRTDELAALRAAFDRVEAEGAVHMVTVAGAPGLGKSRLAVELIQAIGTRATALTGRCRSYGRGITYRPLREIFRQMGAEDELERALSWPTREETSRAVRAGLERWARDRALLLVFEDLHWAEQTLLDLIAQIRDLSAGAPILVVCLARPEFLDERPGWDRSDANGSILRLDPLPPDESAALLRSRAGDAADEQAIRRIVERAGGNPLFLEEMLAMVADGSGADLPSTIQSLLVARLERLAPGEIRAAELASVVGASFAHDAIVALAPEPLATSVSSDLDSLARRGWIGRDPDASGMRSVFRHELIREAAYSRLPKAERADLHERFATWLEGGSGDRAELDEILGYHLEQAHRWLADLGAGEDEVRSVAARAAAHLATAGAGALARSDMTAAAGLLGRACALLPPGDRTRTALLPDLGAALRASGDLAAAETALTQAVDEVRASGSDEGEARAVAEQVLLQMLIDPGVGGAKARREGERLLAMLEGSNDERSLAKAWELIGTADLYASRYADMERSMARSLEHAERAGDRQQAASASQWVSVAVVGGPTTVVDGIARLKRLRAAWPPGSEADAGLLVNLAMLHAMAGDIDEARELVASGRAIFKELGMELMWAVYAMELSMIELNGGDATLAIPALEEACEALERMGDQDFFSSATLLLAQCLVAGGDDDAADAWARKGEETAPDDDMPSQITLHSVRGVLLARRGEFADAETNARAAVDLAETGDNPVSVGDALCALAEVLARAARPEEARACLQRALGLYERKGATALVDRTNARLAELPVS